MDAGKVVEQGDVVNTQALGPVGIRIFPIRYG